MLNLMLSRESIFATSYLPKKTLQQASKPLMVFFFFLSKPLMVLSLTILLISK